MNYNKGMIRKVFKTGHSVAITISQDMLKQMGLKVGDTVKVEIDDKKERIIIRHGSKASQLALGFKVRAKL